MHLMCYMGGIDNGTAGPGKQLFYFSALTDENVVRTDSKGDYELGSKGQFQTDWGVAEVYWTSDYVKIRQANRFLENIERVYIADASTKNRYKYEAKAIRAYLHMQLLMLYGGVPILTSSLAPNESAVKRNTADEVYNFVVAELSEAAIHLPGNIPSNVYSNTDNYRMSYGACWALISRLALYVKKYDIARDAAQKVINSQVFQLYRSTVPANSYGDLFNYNGQLNNERILFSRSGATDAWNSLAPYGMGGITTLSPTAALVNTYETKQGKVLSELGADSLSIYQNDPNYNNNRDPRLTASVLLPKQTFGGYVLDPFNAASPDKIGNQFATATGYWQKKYLDTRDRNGIRTLDFVLFRYAEVLLNYVEAQVELGQWTDTKILTYLNDIRSRAGMPNVNVSVYNNQDKLRDLVRRERRVELAFEGQRFFDIRRWGILGNVMNGAVFGANNPDTKTPVLVETRSTNASRDLIWPIPRPEMIANPNMVQNPQYQ
jgi:hypothetical protein